MATIPSEDPPLNMREQLARIDKMQAEIQKMIAEAAKVRTENKLAVWTVAFTGLGAGAALFAAGAAFAKLVFG